MPNTDVMVLSDFTFELGKIKWLRDNTTIDRFLLVQDSIIFKKERIKPKRHLTNGLPTLIQSIWEARLMRYFLWRVKRKLDNRSPSV